MYDPNWQNRYRARVATPREAIVTSFVMGTRRLYDWVHDNPLVELRPSDFTNDPMTMRFE